MKEGRSARTLAVSSRTPEQGKSITAALDTPNQVPTQVATARSCSRFVAADRVVAAAVASSHCSLDSRRSLDTRSAVRTDVHSVELTAQRL